MGKEDKTASVADVAPVKTKSSLFKKKDKPKGPPRYRAIVFMSFIAALLAIAALIVVGLMLEQQLHWQNQSNRMAKLYRQTITQDMQKTVQTNRHGLMRLSKQQHQLNQQLKRISQGSAAIIKQNQMSLAHFRQLNQQQLKQLQMLSIRMHLDNAQHLLLNNQPKAWVVQQVQQALSAAQSIGKVVQPEVEALSYWHKRLQNLPNLQPLATVQKLQLLQSQLKTLRFKRPIAENQPHAASVEHDKGWKAVWNDSMTKLKSMVIIQRDQAVSTRLLTTADRLDALRKTLLLFAQAESSATMGHQKAYQQSLQQLYQQIQSMTQNNKAKHALLAQLKSLQGNHVGYAGKLSTQAVKGLGHLAESIGKLAQ